MCKAQSLCDPNSLGMKASPPAAVSITLAKRRRVNLYLSA